MDVNKYMGELHKFLHNSVSQVFHPTYHIQALDTVKPMHRALFEHFMRYPDSLFFSQPHGDWEILGKFH